MIPWESLTAKLDEIDTIRAQLREARAQERTASFFQILLARTTVQEHAHVGDAVVLSGGWCIVHWVHAERRGVAFYESLALLGNALQIDGEFLLSWVDTSERRARPRSSQYQAGTDLTPRERRVLQEIGHGKSNQEIATALRLSPSTVKNSTTRIYKKLGVLDRVQAALLARDLDLSEET